MRATEDELRAFAERRQRDEEQQAVAWLGGRYRQLGDALDVVGSYLGRLATEHRDEAVRELAGRIALTVRAETAVLAVLGHPLVSDQPAGGTRMKWINRALAAVATVAAVAGGVALLGPIGVPAAIVAVATKVALGTVTVGVVAAKVLPGHGTNKPQAKETP